MSDPRLHSLHLEGQPRRDQFRAARQAIQAACGSQTLAGDLKMAAPDERLDASTLAVPPGGPIPGLAGRFTFFLKDGGNVYPLHLGLNSVGRLPDNDVVIRDECVSRRHCAVVVHHDLRCELHDVASKNGTLLNGKKIPGPTKLQSGDQITLCGRRLTFHITELTSEPAAAV
jgi:pSer/pThr/pTyr-binding forkhead associated (FHA) protein